MAYVKAITIIAPQSIEKSVCCFSFLFFQNQLETTSRTTFLFGPVKRNCFGLELMLTSGTGNLAIKKKLLKFKISIEQKQANNQTQWN